MKALGAAETVGVDLSSEMIGLARAAETSEPLGCRYEVADVADLGALGQFDIVVAAYLLNYAHSRDELRRLCAAAGANLRHGGRLLGVNDYTDDGVTGTRDLGRHGFRTRGPEPYVEGNPIVYDFELRGGRSFEITNYYWSPATYLDALREAGFREPRWRPFTISPSSPFAPSHWDEFTAAIPCAAYNATR